MTLAPAPLCPNGPSVSPLIAGLWRLRHWGMPAQRLLQWIEQCVDLGVTTMDHAMVYRSEALFGEALALKPALREQLQIISKCGIRPVGFSEFGAQATNHYDSSAPAIIASVDASLRNLRTDYLDILLLHRPDYLMDIQATAEAFAQLKQQGKVRFFGVSNFNTSQFQALQQVWSDGLVTNQVELSPYEMAPLDSGVLDQCQMLGVRPMLWSCLGGGRLMTPEDDKGRRIYEALQAVGEEIGAQSVDQVVYAWVLALPSQPVPLLGTQKIERIQRAVEAVHLALSREQWYRIWEAANGAPVP